MYLFSRKKRSTNEMPSDYIKESFLLEITLHEGPIRVMKSEYEGKSIGCYVNLNDFDQSYTYENTISRQFTSAELTKSESASQETRVSSSILVQPVYSLFLFSLSVCCFFNLL